MNISKLLDIKGRDVVTVSAGVTLQAISELLEEKGIGAAVVRDDEGDICGIISERDVIRKIAQEGPDVLCEPVSCSMTPDVICGTGREDLEEVLELMSEHRFRHLPVVQDGKLAGLVSIGDVVKHKIADGERNAQDLMRYIAG